MIKDIKHILSSMRGVFLPYQGDNSLIPGGRVRIDELSYYGIYDDKKRMKGDMARLAQDFRESTEEAKKKIRQIQ